LARIAHSTRLAIEERMTPMTIPVRPILSSLTRHKAGVFLIALQVALTLAIVANAIFVISQRVIYISRPSGIDESNIVVVDNRWVGAPTFEQAQAKTAADLAMLRQLPGVSDAYADYSFPAAGPWASVWGIGLAPDQKSPTSFSEPYFADEHTLATYGVRLLAGRNFRADEVTPGSQLEQPTVGPIIITQDLGRKLFTDGSALGKVVYVGNVARTIIGVISDMEVPAVSTRSFAYRSILSPIRWSDEGGAQYIVHAKPGQAEHLRTSLAAALYKVSRLRIIDPIDGVQSFHALRSTAYSRDRGLVILLSAASIILLLATAGGIVGITVFWVDERRRQIGLRRALGARRFDILAHILTENFLIIFLGISAGSLLAFTVNLALMHYLEMTRLPAAYIAVGSALLLILGQCAALTPARRAARMSPMEATRAAAG
jgi:putative ABC transport system permease protein